jgi:hypothetical protein
MGALTQLDARSNHITGEGKRALQQAWKEAKKGYVYGDIFPFMFSNALTHPYHLLRVSSRAGGLLLQKH